MNECSMASGLTHDSLSSLDITDLDHPSLPIMVESSSTEMSASCNSGLGATTGVQLDLRWGCDRKLAQRYCLQDTCESGKEDEDDFCFEIQSTFEEDAKAEMEQKGRIRFYDSISGKALFMIQNENSCRSFDAFLQESIDHGHLCFRDYEVNWELVRCIPGGEMFSTDGTKLGYYSPDAKGNKYLINLLAVAGRPVREKKTKVRRRRSMGMLATNPSLAARKGRKALKKMLSGLEVDAIRKAQAAISRSGNY